MDHFVIWIKQHTGWLYVKIYENQFFFLDFWSIAHLWSGFILFILLLALRYRHPWIWLTIYLSIYEIVELAMLYLSLHVFLPETIKDQVTDILVGIFGGLLSYLFINQKYINKITLFEKIDTEALIVAMTISFLWVDRSQFFFFQPEGANPLSVFNYLWRLLLGYLLLRIYASYRRIGGNVTNGLLVFLMAYYVLFILTGFLSEYFTFNQFLNVLSVEKSGPFNSSFFIYQLWFPFLAILLYGWTRYLIAKAVHEMAIKNPPGSAVSMQMNLVDGYKYRKAISE